MHETHERIVSYGRQDETGGEKQAEEEGRRLKATGREGSEDGGWKGKDGREGKGREGGTGTKRGRRKEGKGRGFGTGCSGRDPDWISRFQLRWFDQIPGWYTFEGPTHPS